MLKISNQKAGRFARNAGKDRTKLKKDESITTFSLLISETTLIKKHIPGKN
jgi:hypothetical protein